jgi:hypothetical protein
MMNFHGFNSKRVSPKSSKPRKRGRPAGRTAEGEGGTYKTFGIGFTATAIRLDRSKKGYVRRHAARTSGPGVRASESVSALLCYRYFRPQQAI